jgi:hypothetical protein
VQAQNKASVARTDELSKTADSMACTANPLLIGCFEKWDDINYNKFIGFLNQAKAIYQRLMMEGTSQTTELAELMALMTETRISVIETKLMLFDDIFAKLMKNPGNEKMTKKKYNGSVLLIPKSVVHKFDNLTSTVSVYCE